jgi:NAD(P)-dependent dehydrogenase (short-subunit alcohol dehydrogenase family)
LGNATARLLAESGHVVYGTGRSQAPPDDGFHYLQMDVNDDQSVARTVGEILEKEGRIDVLVNNAGFGLAAAIENFTTDEVAKQMGPNFFGAVKVTRAVLPSMRTQQSGLIINISSVGGIIGLPFQGLYSASKFAMEGFSEALGMEVKPFNIRVVVVNPGDFLTGFTANRRIGILEKDDSPYHPYFDRALKKMEKDEHNGCDPRLIARTIGRIIRKKSPHYRYVVGRFDQRLMARIKPVLPHWLVDYLISDHYNISRRTADGRRPKDDR